MLVQTKRLFLGLKVIRNQPQPHIDKEIDRVAMQGMLDLTEDLDLINDRLYYGALSQQQVIRQSLQTVLHFRPWLCNHVNINDFYQEFEEWLGEIALIDKQITEHVSYQSMDRFAIVNVAFCERQIEQLASIIDNPVRLETEEPASRILISLGDIGKNFVLRDIQVVTCRQGC